MIDHKFDVIGITESKIKKNIEPKIDISIPGYKYFHVDTEADKGGSLIYVSTEFSPEPRKDLQNIMYKSEMLESTFIELVNPGKKIS